MIEESLKKGRFCDKVSVTTNWEYFELLFQLSGGAGEDELLGKFYITPEHAKRIRDILDDKIRRHDEYEECEDRLK